MATKTAEIHSLAARRGQPAKAPEKRPLRVVLFARQTELFGAERALLRLAIGFMQWPNFRPMVVLPGEGGLSQRCRAHGIQVLICGYVPLAGTQRAPISTTRQLARNLRVWPRLLRRLARFSPDVIYSSTASVAIGAAAARQLDVAHVWHVQELPSPNKAGNGRSWPLSRQLMRGTHNRIVANSEAVRDCFSELLQSEEVTTIHEGFDFPPLPRTRPEDKYRALITDAPVIELATAGLLAEGKGQEDAIHAVGDLIQRGHRVHLNIAGEGTATYTRHLRELVSRYRLDQCVTFLGFTADPGLLFERSAIALVCGHSEGFGRAAVEASSRGTPVIGTDNGGLPEILRPGRTGLLYSAGDWRSLSDRIQALLQDQQLYAEIATAAAVWSRQRFPARRYVREMGQFITRSAVEKQPHLEDEIDSGPTPLHSKLVENAS